MAKTSAIQKNLKRIKLVKKFAKKRAALKNIINNKKIITIVNKDFAKGLSSSLQCGISALPDDCDAAVIILADMPSIESTVIDNIINSFNPKKNNSIIIPTFNNKKGNYV